MLLVRYVDGSGRPAVGRDDDGRIRALRGRATISELLGLGLDELRAACDDTVGDPVPAQNLRLLPPVDGLTEVWAAGVTYKRSREARVEESTASADVYERVYSAERPELFFKSTAWRVTGDGEQVCVRSDSAVNVPEPELALVLNSRQQIVGYTVCNDCSSRSIEGDNPLYLPQAKVFLGSCALGPGIRPSWEVADPYDLGISMSIERSGTEVWRGGASTAELHRTFEDLTEHLFRADAFPYGVVLSTGTCLVPDLPFTLLADDRISIVVDQVGVLTSHVVHGKSALGWLAASAAEPARRPVPVPTPAGH